MQLRNLQLDELELASLRGTVERVECCLDLEKRRGSGSLSVLRPRFSGLQCNSLDASVRWAGDVVTLERSVLEQKGSRYEMAGEYVLPGVRERGKEEEVVVGKDMAGQVGRMMTSMGRWRLKLEVPEADVAEMLPAARLLRRSRDPRVLFRSKERFVQHVPTVGHVIGNLNDHLEVQLATCGMWGERGVGL